MDAIATLTGGQGFDYGFEVVGKSQAIITAWQATRRGGDVIVVGAGAMDDMVPFNAFSLLFDGKNLLSSCTGAATSAVTSRSSRGCTRSASWTWRA